MVQPTRGPAPPPVIYIKSGGGFADSLTTLLTWAIFLGAILLVLMFAEVIPAPPVVEAWLEPFRQRIAIYQPGGFTGGSTGSSAGSSGGSGGTQFGGSSAGASSGAQADGGAVAQGNDEGVAQGDDGGVVAAEEDQAPDTVAQEQTTVQDDHPECGQSGPFPTISASLHNQSQFDVCGMYVWFVCRQQYLGGNFIYDPPAPSGETVALGAIQVPAEVEINYVFTGCNADGSEDWNSQITEYDVGSLKEGQTYPFRP
jgi:hypothetical protein